MNNKALSISIPIFEKEYDGAIKPNYLFHRPYNRIHSRCIEYPWCASNYNGETNILDVGSAKSDYYWIRWLESLNANVYLTDYDTIEYKSDKLKKIQCDIRNIGCDSNYFDVIFAVSVLEHIGLKDPQVICENKPETDDFGDIQAFQELIRILKPGGKIFLTIPFSNEFKLIFKEQARCYSLSTINRFSLPNVKRTSLDIYQYLPLNKNLQDYYDLTKGSIPYFCEIPGLYCWKKIDDFTDCLPLHKWCVDCVALAIYEKLDDYDNTSFES
ncbi:MAG TPA: class I SAM-dependent methyltransferase [Bacillota bacterium]|nr:class I SAM-dependent methyltransferase [Bacillota bacterium]